MLYVKFYTSIFILSNIHCKITPNMVMLPLQISSWWDTIDMHLFESYQKQTRFKKMPREPVSGLPKQKNNDLICEIGRFFMGFDAILKLMKTSKKRTIIIVATLISIIVALSATGVLATILAQREPDCSYIVGDGYSMGLDPEPVIISAQCDGKAATHEQLLKLQEEASDSVK